MSQATLTDESATRDALGHAQLLLAEAGRSTRADAAAARDHAKGGAGWFGFVQALFVVAIVVADEQRTTDLAWLDLATGLGALATAAVVALFVAAARVDDHAPDDALAPADLLDAFAVRPGGTATPTTPTDLLTSTALRLQHGRRSAAARSSRLRRTQVAWLSVMLLGVGQLVASVLAVLATA